MEHFLRTYFLRLFFLITVGLVSLTGFGAREKFNSRLNDGEVVSNATFKVVDDKYLFMQSNPTTWNQSFSSNATNRVILSIDPSRTLRTSLDYSTTVALEITYYYWNGSAFVTSTVTPSLTVNYDSDSTHSYTDKAVYQLPLNLVGGNKMSVKVVSVTTTGSGTPHLTLEGEIEVERYYVLDETASIPSGNLSHNDLSSTRGELEIYWTTIAGAEEYDLEWTYVNNYASDGTALSASSVLLPSDLFKNNSTRVTVSTNSYRIPIIYERGYILYRIRGVGRKGATFQQPAYGKWSYTDGTYSNASSMTHKFLWAGHTDYLNWNSSMSFAEKGKTKVGIGYFDGSLKNRQSVSKINSTDQIVVGETIYDYQGRGTIQVLPVPVIAPKIGYQQYFNVIKDGSTMMPYSAEYFDKDVSACTGSTPGMDTSSGASEYYSPNNPRTDNIHAYVPDAFKYPFAQVQYTPDNTGRIKSQSGVGLDHKLGSGHETKYFYAKPFQEELDRLFGSDVGYCDFYQKHLTRDANGQMSVSYHDLSGNVIATALTGESPSPLEALDSNKLAPGLKIDLLSKTDPADTTERSFLNKLSTDGKSLLYSQPLLVATSGARPFYYRVDGQKFGIDCNNNSVDDVCYECVLDVEISLTDECGHEYLPESGNDPITETVGNQHAACSTAVNAQYIKGDLTSDTWTSGSLPVGNYTLSKKLTVNQAALDYYTDQYFSNTSLCLKTLTDFQDSAIADIDTSGCGLTCAACSTKVGASLAWDTHHPYNKDNPNCEPCLDADEYALVLQQCGEFCDNSSVECQSVYSALLGDVGKMGQYGEFFDTATATVNVSKYPLSVYNEGNLLPIRSGYPSLPNWRHPYNPGAAGDKATSYLDEYGEIAYVTLELQEDGSYRPQVQSAHNGDVTADPNNPEVYRVKPNYLLNVEDFLAVYDLAWASSLVRYHPEYPYYEFCVANDGNGSNNWDSKWISTENISTASAITGYRDPLVSGGDPYFVYDSGNPTSQKSKEYTAMNTAMDSYIVKGATTLSIWQMAVMLANCPNYDPAISSCVGDCFTGRTKDSIDTDKEWVAFRDLYRSLKNRMMERTRTIQAIAGNGYNGCIGKESFNPFADNFFWTHVTSGTITYWWNWSQFYNNCQPCNAWRYYFYRDKTPRYPTLNDAMDTRGGNTVSVPGTYDDASGGDYPIYSSSDTEGLIEQEKAEADRALFEQCGQCPMARNLQTFLDGVSQGGGVNSLKTDFNISCEPTGKYGLVKDLANVISGTGAVYWNFVDTTTSGSNNILKVYLEKPQGTVACTLQLALPSAHRFGNIKSICCLEYITNPVAFSASTNKNFRVMATFDTIISGQAEYVQVPIEGVTTCINVGGCTFPSTAVCRTTQTGNDFQTLCNALLYHSTASPAIGQQFTCTTAVALSAAPYADIIASDLAKQGPTGSWTWTASVSGNNMTVALAGGTTCTLAFHIQTSPTPPFTFTFSDIQSFSNIRADKGSSDPERNFIITALVKNSASPYQSAYIDLKGYAPCFTISQCGSNLPSLISHNDDKATLPFNHSSDADIILGTPVNQLKNGDFSLGNTGFYTDYTHMTTSTGAGSYNVDNDLTKSLYTGTGWVGAPRNTGSGNFMIVNGNEDDELTIWQDTVTVKPYTAYIFSGWLSTLYYTNPSAIEIYINGSSMWDVINAPSVQNAWEQFAITWDGSSSTTAIITIKVVDNAGDGNDMGLDDLSFGEKYKLLNTPCNTNLVQNGSFNTGNNGFDPDFYNPNPHTGTPAQGTYDVVADGSSYSIATGAVKDHTNGGNKFLAVRGSTTANRTFWYEEDVIVKPDTKYEFSFWYRKLNCSTTPSNFLVMVNNDTLGTVVVSDLDRWKKYTAVWTCTNTRYTMGNPTQTYFDRQYPIEADFKIIETTHNGSCNDFGIDDIAFKEVCPCFPELVMNGNFEEGDQGFETDYVYDNLPDDGHAPFHPYGDTLYYNVSDFPLWGPTRNQTGNALVVGFTGSSTNLVAWQQKVAVEPYTYYDFSFFVNEDEIDWGGDNVIWYINGVCYDTIETDHFYWYKASTKWYSGSATSADIAIYTNNPLGSYKVLGDLIVLDNISLRKSCGNPSSLCNPPIVKKKPLPDYAAQCAADLQSVSLYNAQAMYETYIAAERIKFQQNYIAKCLDVYERFQMKYDDREYQYTLYYYDQAGNLARTIPPQGVVKVPDTDFPKVRADRLSGNKNYFTQHTMATTYTYNSLDQLVAQSSPDTESQSIWSVASTNTGNGIPSGYTVKGAQFSSPDVGYVITTDGSGNGHIFTTKDGGVTWSGLTTVGISDLKAVQWTDGSHAYAIGDNGTFLKTVNTGTDWTIVPIGTTGNFTHLFFSSTSVGKVFDNKGVLYKTSDGGLSWTSIDKTTSLSSLANRLVGTITDIHFADAYYGFATSELNGKGYLYSTSDGGDNWTVVNSISGGNYNSVSMTSSGTAYLAGADGSIFVSSADGHWDVKASNLSESIKKLYFKNDNLTGCAILSTTGAIWKTTDGGATYASADATATYTDMYFRDENTGYAVATSGKLITTTDGGLTWTTLNSNIGTTNLASVYFIDGSNGFIGCSGTLYKTTNGGTTWTLMSSPTISGNVTILNARSDKRMTIMGGGVIYTTADYTITTPVWSTITTPVTISNYTSGYFQDADHGYAVSSNSDGPVVKTIDGGVTWTNAGYVNVSGLKAVSINNNNLGYALAGTSGAVYKTSDGGLSWETQTNNVRPLSLSGVFMVPSSTTAYASGKDGTVLKTTDGVSFAKVATGRNEDLGDMHFTSTTTGTIGGKAGFLLSTANGGTSWTTPSSGITEDIKQVYYISTDGYAVGNKGTISKYSGSTWSSQSSSVTENLLGVNFYSTTLGVAVGSSGRLIKCTSGTWSKVSEVASMKLYATQLVKGGNGIGYSVGDAGTIVKTTDNGLSWVNKSSGTTIFNSLAFTSVTNGVVVGNGGTVIKTVNGGDNWTTVTSPSPTYNLKDIAIAPEDPNFWIIVGDNGTIWKTTDNGASFTTYNTVTSVNLNSVYIADKTTIYIAGNSGKIIKGTNNGTTWTLLTTTGTTSNLNDVYFRDYQTGYAVGQGGTMIKTINGGTTWTTETTSTTSDLNTIALQDEDRFTVGGASSDITLVNDQQARYASKIWYDRLGRMIATQNSKQYNASPTKYSYVKYDALGRVIETGEVATSVNIETTKKTASDSEEGVIGQILQSKFETWVDAGTGTEINKTYYDAVISNLFVPNFTQEELRNRVASSTYQETEGSFYNQATHYSYDMHGNVKTLVQENPSLAYLSQQYKRLDYTYDLASGNVYEVAYQKGEADQFIHHYYYDADNRVTNVLTSKDGITWDQDGKYLYYDHNELARTEIGEHKVQGIDYTYTIEGLLKGVNSNTLKTARDIGKDGDATNPNTFVAQDEFGYSLGYFNGDYSPIKVTASNNFEMAYSGKEISPTTTGNRELFDGNISHTVTQIRKFMNRANGTFVADTTPLGASYTYDQLNRLKSVTTHKNSTTGVAANTWDASGTTKLDYAENFTYDNNGNILFANRNANASSDAGHDDMDSLEYIYENISKGYVKNTNRLRRVIDHTVASPAAGDIENGQGVDNYDYDEIGNLISDEQENIKSIEWTVSGKVKKIIRYNYGETGYQSSKASAPDLEYAYDALGNRIMKLVKPRSSGALSNENNWTYTYYVRDASGNVMATYNRSYTGSGSSYTDNFKVDEHNIYGSSRLGISDGETTNLASRTFTATMPSGTFTGISYTAAATVATLNITTPVHILGKKAYELNNHLGNVLAVVSDRFTSYDSGSDGIADGYNAVVLSAQHYYAFGMILPGMTFNSSDYKYGFNGMEKDNELKGEGNNYSTEFRQYDPRLGRWFSPDPLMNLFADQSPYNFVFNNPINLVDPFGLKPDPPVGSKKDKKRNKLPKKTEEKKDKKKDKDKKEKDKEDTGDFAIPIAFPDQTAKVNQEKGILRHIVGDKDLPVGHAGVIIIDRETGKTRYFDFGRYNERNGELGKRSTGDGVVRSGKTVPQLKLPNAKIVDGEITNMNDILSKLADNTLFNGYKRMTASLYKGLNFDAMENFARGLESKGFIKFGGYVGGGKNTNYCARFAREVIKAGGGGFGPSIFSGAQNVSATSNKNGTPILEFK